MRLICVVMVCLIPAGCVNHRQPAPVLGLAEVIQAVNANNVQINQLLCKRVNLIVKFKDDEGHRRRFDMTGALRYQRPRYLYLSGDYLGKSALRLGCNEEKYWLGVIPEQNTLWWGSWADADKDCSQELLIEPDKFIEALGLGLLEMGEEGLFGPALDRRQESNVLIYQAWDQQGQHYYIAREVYLQRRRPFLITQIVYKDADGQVRLCAKLAAHKPLDKAGPWLARRIELHWPQQEGYFRADLHRIVTNKPVSSSVFKPPDSEAYQQVYDVDADCR